MKNHYDFSKGEKGKFYVPKSEIELPIYLDPDNQEFFMNLADQKNINLSTLINKILSKGKDIAKLFVSE